MMVGEGLIFCLFFLNVYIAVGFSYSCIYMQFLSPPSGGATGTKHKPEACCSREEKKQWEGGGVGESSSSELNLCLQPAAGFWQWVDNTSHM